MSVLDGMLISEGLLGANDDTSSILGGFGVDANIIGDNVGNGMFSIFEKESNVPSKNMMMVMNNNNNNNNMSNNSNSNNNAVGNKNCCDLEHNETNKGQLCLPSNYRILGPVLRLARENRWVSDWIFRIPVLAGSTPVTPEMFGHAMVAEVDERFVEEFGMVPGISSNEIGLSKGTIKKHIKTMNVPVSTIGSITIGYSFCSMSSEVACPIAALKKGVIQTSSDPEVFFGRFAFDSQSKEILLICPHVDLGITQMMWARQGGKASDTCGGGSGGMSSSSKRFRAMLAVPGNIQYGWSNLPTQVLVSNVYEEFRDPSYNPQMEFQQEAKNILIRREDEDEAERAMSPFSSCTDVSSSSNPQITTSFDTGAMIARDDPNGMMVLMNDNNIYASPSLDHPSPNNNSNNNSMDVFNLNAMSKAIGEIELLFKGQFHSPITLTDVYDIKSGRLLSRKTENMTTRMDRIISAQEEIQFRTIVAQAYYSKYYSPAFDLPLLPGVQNVQDSLSSSSSISSPSNSCTPEPPSNGNDHGNGHIGGNNGGNNGGHHGGGVSILGPTKRIRKAARLAPRPVSIEQGKSNSSNGNGHPNHPHGVNDDVNESSISEEDEEEKRKKAKEAKAYAKKIRNRESAARSNARRRKHIEAVKKELEILTREKEDLIMKKKNMMDENAKMKASLVEMYSTQLG